MDSHTVWSWWCVQLLLSFWKLSIASYTGISAESSLVKEWIILLVNSCGRKITTPSWCVLGKHFVALFVVIMISVARVCYPWTSAPERLPSLFHQILPILVTKWCTGNKNGPKWSHSYDKDRKTVMRTENGTKSIHAHDNFKIVMRTRKTVWNLSILVTTLWQ